MKLVRHHNIIKKFKKNDLNITKFIEKRVMEASSTAA